MSAGVDKFVFVRKDAKYFLFTLFKKAIFLQFRLFAVHSPRKIHNAHFSIQ